MTTCDELPFDQQNCHNELALSAIICFLWSGKKEDCSGRISNVGNAQKYEFTSHDFEGLKASLSALKDQHKEMLDRLIEWSRINSGSSNLDGLKIMEERIATAFAPLGATVEFIQLEPTERLNHDGTIESVANGRSILISKRPSANRRLLLTGHFDTVFPDDSSFQDVTWLDDNILNGPGVADMKGGILVMLHALLAFEASDEAENLGWEVLLSPEEETGSLASAPILAERAKRAQIGLTYEPALADGTLAGARAGSGNWSLVVKGKAAHAGREFDLGKNAVVKLSEIIGELSSLTGGRPKLTVNPAVITGGVAPNIVPDQAFCRFNARVHEPGDAVWLQEKLAEIISKHNADDGFDVILHGGINRPPKPITDAIGRLMEAVKACGAFNDIKVDYVATGGCCEGNNLAAAGLPNVDTLGVRGGKIHSADEFVCVDSLTERAALSATILYAFAKGYLDSVIEQP